MNRAEHAIREEKVQSDEIIAREKIIQANLERALGANRSSLLNQDLEDYGKKKKKKKGDDDVSEIVGTFAKTKGALKQMAKYVAIAFFNRILLLLTLLLFFLLGWKRRKLARLLAWWKSNLCFFASRAMSLHSQ